MAVEAMETVTKTKSPLAVSLKNKANAVKTQLIILSLLSGDKKTLLAAITKKLHTLLGHHQPKLPPPPPPLDDHQLYVDQNVSNSSALAHPVHTEVVKPAVELAVVAERVQEMDCRKDREDDEEEVKQKEEEEEEEEEVMEKWKEEEKIDEKAELFIKRFHYQMRMQKQQSFQDEPVFAAPSHSS